MTDPPATPTHRIEDLARLSRTTVRTIRAYQDKGLLPRPERQGRANLYSDVHLTRLHQIADLLSRGYTLASIKELLDAWDTGRGLAGVLGLVTEAEGPWSDEEPVRLTRADLDARFGGTPTTRPWPRPWHWAYWNRWPTTPAPSSSRAPRSSLWRPSCTRPVSHSQRSPSTCVS